MEECKYRKMICNAGHETRPYSEGETLPKRCPVCNQPYDRRYNRPIFCYQDGTVPEENANADDKKNDTDNLREKVDEDSSMKKSKEPLLSNQNNSLRRGRSLAVNDTHSVYNPERGRKSSIINEQDTDTSVLIRNSNSEKITKVGLFNGGDCIIVSNEGGYLGREEQGQEFLKLNPLISRKHVYVKINHFGKIQVKDEGSLNGTYIDDGDGRRKLKPYETVELKIGDTIWLANHILAIEEIKC